MSEPPQGFTADASRIGNPAHRVSILIVNYNGAKFLRGCLESVAKVTSPLKEVVVVDNGSSDDSVDLLKGYPWVRVVRSDTNRGFAGGNNLGLTHCTGEYVLLLNNDTVVVPDFLDALVGYLQAHPQVGIVQGKMVLPRFGGALDVCGSFLTALGFPYHYGLYKPDGPKYRRSFPVFSGKGACLMFRRELIPHVGGFLFDEEFFCYYEESDFCHRAWLAGWEVHFVDSPAIEHLMGGTAGGPQSVFVLKHYLRNMTFSLLANLSGASMFRIMPLFFGMLCAAMAASALRLRWGQLGVQGAALLYPLTQMGRLRARRRLIRQTRRQTDGEIFRKVLRTPRLDYYSRTFSGRLGGYQDPELP